MKKLLYVGHNYHLKTKSTKFLMEMFEENYEVSYVSFDPYKKEYVGIEEARGQEFDVLLVFQIQLTEGISGLNRVYFSQCMIRLLLIRGIRGGSTDILRLLISAVHCMKC